MAASIYKISRIERESVSIFDWQNSRCPYPSVITLRPLQISADFETALFEVCAYLPDFRVRLKFRHFSEALALSSKYSMYGCLSRYNTTYKLR